MASSAEWWKRPVGHGQRQMHRSGGGSGGSGSSTGAKRDNGGGREAWGHEVEEGDGKGRGRSWSKAVVEVDSRPKHAPGGGAGRNDAKNTCG